MSRVLLRAFGGHQTRKMAPSRSCLIKDELVEIKDFLQVSDDETQNGNNCRVN